MRLNLKLAVLACVAIGVAAAEAAAEVFDPEVAQEAALAQFDDTDASARSMRVYTWARIGVADLLWLAVPIAAVTLFAGDVTRLLAARH